MKTLTLISPNAKAIKANLKKVFGIDAISCKLDNGRMQLVVKPCDRDKAKSFLTEYDFVHSTGCSVFSINESDKHVIFPNLMIIERC